MSVINQMLRDLEARRGGEPAGPCLGSVISPGPTRSRRPLFLGLALLVAGLLGAVALLLWERHAMEASLPAVSEALPTTPQSTSPAVLPAPAAVLPPAAVEVTTSPAPPPLQPAAVPAPPRVAPQRKSPPLVPVTRVAPPAAAAVPSPVQSGLRKTPRTLSAGQQAERTYADAVERLAVGDHETAESLLKDALRHDSGHRPARETLGGLYLTQGRLVEGEGLLDGGLRQAPGHLPYRRLDARLKLAQGDVGGAIQTLEAGLATADADAESLAFLAALLQQTDRYEESAIAYRKALSLTPRVSVWWLGLGISLEASSDGAEAFAAFRQAIALGLSGHPLAYARERLEVLGKQAVTP